MWVIADEEPIIVTMSWMLVGGDLRAAGCAMRARVADSVIAAAQQSLCQRVRPGDGSRCNPGGGGASRPGVCGEAAGVAVNGSKHRRDIRVSVTHARSPGWSAGQCTGGDILDNGGSAAQGLLAKKLPER